MIPALGTLSGNGEPKKFRYIGTLWESKQAAGVPTPPAGFIVGQALHGAGFRIGSPVDLVHM